MLLRLLTLSFFVICLFSCNTSLISAEDGKDGEAGKVGENGKDGADGKDRSFINLTIGKNGKDGKNGVSSLFNGKDLSGWEIYGTEKWYVADGHLICESGPDKAYGYLATEKTFKNFDLTLEFQQEANGNSGVFFRSSIEGTKITGWQAEVAPPNHSTGGCLLYTSPSPRDRTRSRMPSSA